MRDYVTAKINESAEILNNISADSTLLATVEMIAQMIVPTFQRSNKILVAGNGGSAEKIQEGHIIHIIIDHIFCGLVKKILFKKER